MMKLYELILTFNQQISCHKTVKPEALTAIPTKRFRF